MKTRLKKSSPWIIRECFQRPSTSDETLVDAFDDAAQNHRYLSVVRTKDPSKTPVLLVIQDDDGRSGFLHVPATDHLFVGSGARLLCYDLSVTPPRRRMLDHTADGFRNWALDEETVILAAESELIVYSATGEYLWHTITAPRYLGKRLKKRPWRYKVRRRIAGSPPMLHIGYLGTTLRYPLRPRTKVSYEITIELADHAGVSPSSEILDAIKRALSAFKDADLICFSRNNPPTISSEITDVPGSCERISEELQSYISALWPSGFVLVIEAAAETHAGEHSGSFSVVNA